MAALPTPPQTPHPAINDTTDHDQDNTQQQHQQPSKAVRRYDRKHGLKTDSGRTLSRAEEQAWRECQGEIVRWVTASLRQLPSAVKSSEIKSALDALSQIRKLVLDDQPAINHPGAPGKSLTAAMEYLGSKADDSIALVRPKARERAARVDRRRREHRGKPPGAQA